MRQGTGLRARASGNVRGLPCGWGTVLRRACVTRALCLQQGCCTLLHSVSARFSSPTVGTYVPPAPPMVSDDTKPKGSSTHATLALYSVDAKRLALTPPLPAPRVTRSYSCTSESAIAATRSRQACRRPITRARCVLLSGVCASVPKGLGAAVRSGAKARRCHASLQRVCQKPVSVTQSLRSFAFAAQSRLSSLYCIAV